MHNEELLFLKKTKVNVLNCISTIEFAFLSLYIRLVHTCHYTKDQREIQWGYELMKKKHTFFLPKNPLVLCHGLLGFNKIEIGRSKYFNLSPFIVFHYWRGIKEILEANGIEVFITSVPMMGTVEERSYILHKQIEERYKGKKINLIAHSMGGLDCRYLISKINPKEYKIKSLTTIATPHRGTCFADYCLESVNALNISKMHTLFTLMGLRTRVIEELTTTYMEKTFNTSVIDDPDVMYFSFGAFFVPSFLNIFRISWSQIVINKINKIEGMNDGLVSVKSSIWGNYKGTLKNASHFNVINWVGPYKYLKELYDENSTFNALSFYSSLANMIAMENL
ncbi:hypothetical protein PORY_001378 [Pneumocystis oryctolagi]|uniref:Uncharacterized protein n=1 Tax=Pneumocystis oryctolagi TaxID=42067 RepID=A0ACB7CE21_9ASCO|nr:hypothetical protein PORY_001378 [Pneumocystis oryctolagi]